VLSWGIGGASWIASAVEGPVSVMVISLRVGLREAAL
jgi:hypothetical protein